MEISPSPSLIHLWALANAEAWRCRGTSIEPAHFWIACLKFADPNLTAAMFEQGASPAECSEQAGESKRMLAFLEMDGEDAAALRRTLRGRLLRGQEARPFPDGAIPYLHRSESSHRLFEIALRKAAERSSESLTPMDLAESLFDMKLASLGNGGM